MDTKILPKTLKGAINIHDADAHTRPLNLPVTRCTGVTTNPVAPITSGDTGFTVTGGDGANFPVGTKVSVTEGVIKETVLYTVTIQSTDALTLDMPIGFSFTTAAVIEECVDNMASTAGSLASPVIYELGPPTGQIWHVYRFIVSMTHGSASAENLFGDQAALINGMLFRITNGQTLNFTNWKTNGDMAGDFYDVDFIPKAGSSDFGTRGRGSIHLSSGAVAELDGTAGDKIQTLIQDAGPASLITFGIKFQAHIEGQ